MVLGFGWNDLMEMFRNGTWDDYAKSLLDHMRIWVLYPALGYLFWKLSCHFCRLLSSY